MDLVVLDVMYYALGLKIRKNFHFEIVAVNDVADVETLLHLFKYDTTHGRFPGKVDFSYETERIYMHYQLSSAA